MADMLGIRINIDFENISSVNLKLQRLLKQVQDTNKLHITIDNQTLGDLQNQLKQIESQVKGFNQSFSGKLNVLNPESVRVQSKEVIALIEEMKNKYKSMGEVTLPSINQNADGIKNFIVQLRQADGMIKQIKYDFAGIVQGSGSFYNISNIKTTDNTSVIYEKQDQEAQKLNMQVAKNVEAEKLKTIELEHQLALYKQQAERNILSTQSKYKGLYNTSELDTYSQSVNRLTTTTPNLDHEMQNLNSQFKNITTSAQTSRGALDLTNKSAMSFSEALGVAFSRFPIWIIASTVVMSALHKIGESFQFIEQQSRTFVNLQMEMTDANLKFEEVTKTANDYAVAMGSTTDAVMKAISIFGTYNSTMDTVLEKSRASIILANITGNSTENTSTQLMGTLQQFKLASGDAMHVVDVIAGTARNLQLDYPKAVASISEGINTVGSVARESKVPIELLSSMLGTLAEKTTKSGTEIANGLRTIFGRILNVGEDADPESFKKVEKELNNIGVTIREIGNNGQTLKPVGDILQSLASKWGDLSDAQRQQIAMD